MIKATIDGTLWEFDTVAEAIEFHRATMTRVELLPYSPPTQTSPAPPLHFYVENT